MADDMIGLALQAAYSAPSTYQRAGALAWVAGAVPGRLESARQTAEELALSIELHQDRSFALQQVAAATAYTDLARAESLVEAIPSTSQADQARGEIALTAAQRGHFDIARRLALVVEQPLQRAQVMASLASRLLDAGRPRMPRFWPMTREHRPSGRSPETAGGVVHRARRDHVPAR